MAGVEVELGLSGDLIDVQLEGELEAFVGASAEYKKALGNKVLIPRHNTSHHNASHHVVI